MSKKIYGISVIFLRDVQGTSICLRDFHGIPVWFPWYFLQFLYRNSWDFQGISMQFLWDLYWMSIGFLLDFCGFSIGCPIGCQKNFMGFLWCFKGISMEFPWDFFGMSVIFLMMSTEIL